MGRESQRDFRKITPAATHTYFYDGWMLIKEIVANTNGTTMARRIIDEID